MSSGIVNAKARNPLIAFILFLLISCGGGIDGTGGPSAESRSASVGTVTSNDDSVDVNGVSYDTSTAEIIVDGEVVDDDANTTLSLGDVVTVTADIDSSAVSGVANQIIKNTNLRGVISSIDRAESLITVLEQVVVVSEESIINDVAGQLDQLNEGQQVVISGFPLADNRLFATRIDIVDSTYHSVVAVVSNLDSVSQQFSLNALHVDYSSVVAPSELVDGVLVEARGDQLDNDGSLIATQVRIIASQFNRNVDFVELEGFVTTFTSEFMFSVSNVAVETNRQTEFVGDSPDALALNTKVEIEGTLTDDGRILADRVVFLVANITNLQALDSLSGATESFTWSDVQADEYRLRVVSVEGERIVIHDEYYDGDTLSAVVNGLPENRGLVDVTISTRHDQWWSHKTFRFFGHGRLETSALVSHENGDSLSAETATFSWSDVDADEYRLVIINTGNRLYDQRFDGNTLSVDVAGLPRNRAYLQIDLLTRHGRWWTTRSYRIFSVDIQQNASLLSHSNNAVLSSDTEIFIWDDVGADGYELQITSLSGNGREYYFQSFDSGTTQATVTGLPLNNAIIAVRLFTNHDGFRNTRAYRMYGAGILPDAELNSHSHLEQLTSEQATFTWTEITNADQYTILIRGVDGAGQDRPVLLFDDYDNHITSLTTTGLPRNGALFDIILKTQQSGWWGEYSYRLRGAMELSNAELTSHAEQQVITTADVRFEWTDVEADEYQLTVRDNTSTIIFQSNFGGNILSADVSGLPQNNENLRVQLKTRHGIWWNTQEYQLVSQ